MLLTFGREGGGGVQNRESPDFRSPEVGRYAYHTKWILKYDGYAHKMAKPVLCIDR